MSSIDLDGRVCIVTGASQGLGLAMAEGLARAGAKVVIASPDRANLEAVAKRIGDQSCLAVVADITSEEDCKRIYSDTIERFGDLHALVNNARFAIPKGNRSILNADVAFWRRAVEVNVFGTFLMTSTVVRHLVARGSGRIVNITTSLDTMQRAGNSPYGVTKAAIEAETLVWARDLVGTGVTVNSLIPGGACDVGRVREHAPARAGSSLLPIDVMNEAIVWLVSDHAAAHTGERYVGKLWDSTLPLAEAARRAREPSILRAPELAS